MSRQTSSRLAHAAEDILEDTGRALRRSARVFSEEAGEAISAGAVGVGHAAEELLEDAGLSSRRLIAKARTALVRRPAMAAVIAGAAVLVGLGLARWLGRP